MKTIYEKPIVLANEELSEGVYAASGAQAATGPVSISEIREKSLGNQWNKVNQYWVKVSNSGNEVAKGWSVTISVTSGVAKKAYTYDTGAATATLLGNVITLTCGGRGIDPNSSTDIEVVVEYSSDSVTVGK